MRGSGRTTGRSVQIWREPVPIRKVGTFAAAAHRGNTLHFSARSYFCLHLVRRAARARLGGQTDDGCVCVCCALTSWVSWGVRKRKENIEGNADKRPHTSCMLQHCAWADSLHLPFRCVSLGGALLRGGGSGAGSEMDSGRTESPVYRL